MDVFLTGILILSAISSIITQMIKQAGTKLPSNVLAFLVALVVGIIGNISSTLVAGAEITLFTVVGGVVMGIACAITSMVGYDKVKQCIEQLAAGNTEAIKDIVEEVSAAISADEEASEEADDVTEEEAEDAAADAAKVGETTVG